MKCFCKARNNQKAKDEKFMQQIAAAEEERAIRAERIIQNKKALRVDIYEQTLKPFFSKGDNHIAFY
jgi:hypothetical protein